MSKSGKNLDDMKAVIMGHGGYAPNNRFNIIFTPPTVSLFNLSPTNILGNIINNNFSWKDLISDPRDINVLCKSASFPSRNINTQEFKTTREDRKYVVGKTDGDLNTIFYVTNDMYMKTMFDTWMNYVFNTSNYRANYKKGKTGYSTDVTIQQLNKENKPVYGIRLINAFPTQMGELTLDNSVENGIHELSIGWSYDYYVQEDAITSSIGGVGRLIGNLIS